MTWIDYTIISVYLIGLLAIGWRFRQQSDRQDFFLGKRSLPWQAITLSVMATQLSAVSFISAPAFVGLRDNGGLVWLSYELALPLAMGILLWRLLPTLHSSGVISVYDYLERRFNTTTRLLISAVFQLSRSFATAIMIYAISLILQGTMGIEFWVSICLIGVITLVYSAVGGMKAVIYSDAIQMVLIIGGAITCLAVALYQIGGIGEAMSQINPDRFNAIRATNLGMNGNDFGLLPMFFGGLVLYASYYGCDQSEAQRSLSSKSLPDLRKILLSVAFLRFPITIIYCCAGLVIGALVLSTPEVLAQIPADKPDWMMPIFIINYLPTGIIGILIVAILAAAMSSLSSAINSLSAVSVEDYCRMRKHKPNDSEYVGYARLTGVFWGLLTLTLSFFAGDIAPTVIEAINKIGSVFYGPILAIFLLGIHSKRVSALHVNIGLGVGVFTNVVLWLSGSTIFWFWWNVIGFGLCIAVAMILSRFANQPNTSDPIEIASASLINTKDLLLLSAYTLVLVAICWFLSF